MHQPTTNSKIIIGGLVVALVVIGASVWLYQGLKDPALKPPSTQATFRVPSHSTVTVPTAVAVIIEQVATDSIPTHAAAGSQSQAIFTSYSSGKAAGYLTYQAAPNHPASFVAVRDAQGNWKIASYHVADACPTCMGVAP